MAMHPSLTHSSELVKFDGFEKRPISALRFIPRHCGVPLVRLIPRDSRRLELERFSLPSFDDFLQVHQVWDHFFHDSIIRPDGFRGMPIGMNPRPDTFGAHKIR
jgi:hypothetical protein